MIRSVLKWWYIHSENLSPRDINAHWFLWTRLFQYVVPRASQGCCWNRTELSQKCIEIRQTRSNTHISKDVILEFESRVAVIYTRHWIAMPTTVSQRVSALCGLCCPVPIVKCLENHSCIWSSLEGKWWWHRVPLNPKVFSERPDALVYVQSLRVQTAIKWFSASSPRERKHTMCVWGCGLVYKDGGGKPTWSACWSHSVRRGREVCKHWGPEK